MHTGEILCGDCRFEKRAGHPPRYESIRHTVGRAGPPIGDDPQLIEL